MFAGRRRAGDHQAGQATTYDVTGGPIDKALAALVANLAVREDELGDWNVVSYEGVDYEVPRGHAGTAIPVWRP